MSLSNQNTTAEPKHIPTDLNNELFNNPINNSEQSSEDKERQEPKAFTAGTIFMGPNPLLEVSLKSFTGHANAKLWDEKTEQDYMERIKKRATLKVTEMLNNAKTEAERIHKEAQENGYAEGLANAKAELEEFRKDLGASVGTVIESIQGQSSKIFDKYRDDLVLLTKQAVEKVLAYELSQEKSIVLENLFKQALIKLDNRSNIVVKVNPDDEFIINDIIESAKLKYPDLKTWRVQADSNIQSGGILIESQDSLIDNRIESRKQIVQEVLDSLNLNENIA